MYLLGVIRILPARTSKIRMVPPSQRDTIRVALSQTPAVPRRPSHGVQNEQNEFQMRYVTVKDVQALVTFDQSVALVAVAGIGHEEDGKQSEKSEDRQMQSCVFTEH